MLHGRCVKRSPCGFEAYGVSRMKARGAKQAGLDLCLPRPLFGQEGQRTLRLEDRVVQFFDELRTPMFRYLLCLSVNPEEADEIIQETFLKLFQHLHSGGRQDSLRSWIFRVAHNSAGRVEDWRRALGLSPVSRVPAPASSNPSCRFPAMG